MPKYLAFAVLTASFFGGSLFADPVPDALAKNYDVAPTMHLIAASESGEKASLDPGSTDNGPDSLKAPDQILEYFKGAIAFAHSAMLSRNARKAVGPGTLAFWCAGTHTRLQAAAFLGLHTYDHHGQMVVYTCVNGLIPGANIPGPNVMGQD